MKTENWREVRQGGRGRPGHGQECGCLLVRRNYQTDVCFTELTHGVRLRGKVCMALLAWSGGGGSLRCSSGAIEGSRCGQDHG